MKLTMKQEIFCQEWVDTVGNGTLAALKAFDIEDKELLEIDVKDRTPEQIKRVNQVFNTAAVMANEYLRKPNISQRIDQILDERGFNDGSVKREHFKVLKQDEDLGTKMRAISDYYKLKGKYESPDEPLERVVTINIIDPNGNKHNTDNQAV